MLNRIKAIIQRVKLAIVQPCPPDLDACESCGRPQCEPERFASCRMRLGFAVHESLEKDFRCGS